MSWVVGLILVLTLIFFDILDVWKSPTSSAGGGANSPITCEDVSISGRNFSYALKVDNESACPKTIGRWCPQQARADCNNLPSAYRFTIWLASVWVKQTLAHGGSCGQQMNKRWSVCFVDTWHNCGGRGWGGRVAPISGWTVTSIGHNWKFHISRKARGGNTVSLLLP